MPIGVRDIFVVNLIIKVIFPLYVWTKEHIEAHFLKPCIYWVWRVFYIHLAAKVRIYNEMIFLSRRQNL